MTMVLRIAGNAARVGFAETIAQYTWRSWTFGWMLRLVSQVLFFAAMGLLVGGDELILYAFVGNVIAAAANWGLAVGPDTAWERFNGTLPLLVAAPRSLLPVFGGRSAFHIVKGAGEGLLIFGILAPLIGFRGRWWWLPVGMLVAVIGTYGLGLAIAAFSINRYRISNLVYNLVFYTLVAIGGVNVPTSVFPGWVQGVAAVLPLHHALLGSRELLANGLTAVAMSELGAELTIGLAWMVVGLIGFRNVGEGGRRDGTLDFAE